VPASQGIAPYRDDSAQLDHVMRLNADLGARLQQQELTELDVQKARMAVHTSSSLMLYVLCASMMDGPLLAHPHLAAFLVTLNLFVWVCTSVARKFG
jgi:hypothetical protein